MEKALIVFSRNKDKKTANLFVNNFLINEDIPFIPRLATDHRGLTLFYYCLENDLEWADLEFDEFTEQLFEIKRGFDYMENPVHVPEFIEERRLHPFDFFNKRK